MKLKKALMAVLLVASPMAIFAADSDIYVCSLQSHSNSDTAYLLPCGNWVSQNSCAGGGWVQWDMSNHQGQAMYSTAMVALMADKKVTLRLDGSSCGHYDKTSMIRINK